MKILSGFFLTLFVLAGCSTAEHPRVIRKNPSVTVELPETISLSNGYLEAAFAPGSMGRMTNLKLNGIELLERFERRVLSGNPLFAPRDCNVYGFRELLWRVPIAPLDLPVNLESKSKNAIVFSAKSYGNTPLSLHREVSLRPGTTVIDIKVKFTNNGAKPYAYSLWLNLLPKHPFSPQIPLADGIKREFKLGNNFHPAGADWTAAKVDTADTILAVNWNPKDMPPDGRFYVHGATTFRTFEAILGKRTLKKGESRLHGYKILVFPQMTQMNALLDETAVASIKTNNGYKLLFCAASPAAERKIKIAFYGSVKDLTLPALKTGEKFEVTYPEEPERIILSRRKEVKIFSSQEKRKLNIVAFGDSITEGKTGVAPEDNWLLKLGRKLGPQYNLFNAGVGGNSAREAMARYEKDVLACNPDIVLIEFGGNNHDPSPARKSRRVPDKEFSSLLEKFKAGLPANCKVVMITFPPIIDEQHVYFKRVPGGKVDSELQSQRQIVRDFAKKNGYPLLDLYKLIYPNRYKLILRDGVHLSPAGHSFFAEEVEKCLKKAGYIR